MPKLTACSQGWCRLTKQITLTILYTLVYLCMHQMLIFVIIHLQLVLKSIHQAQGMQLGLQLTEPVYLV